MSALGRVVRSGVGRRRVQTVVIGLVVMVAVAAAVLGGSLMVASKAPFDRAFAQQRGAHLTAQFDAARVTAAALSASARVAGVTAAAGPFQTAAITPVGDDGGPLPGITVAGRAAPGGPVDAVTPIKGRWVTGPGEIVLHNDGTLPEGVQPRIGDVLRLPDVPGTPALTVVGTARSVSRTAGGWVSPDQILALRTPGDTGGYQMLYRFSSADTAGQLETGLAAVRASVPTGSLTGMRPWLTVRTASAGNTALFVPFLVAFGLLGVLMAVLIVGNVIAGAVSTGTRRIGVLKALGFTPHQVVRAYMVQALIPAGAGAALGVAAGDALTVLVLSQTNQVYGTADSGVSLWVSVAVVVGALAVVTATAWVAASRAGRLRTVDVLAVGRTTTTGRGRWAAASTARLRLPRPLTLGLAHPFARASRSIASVAAIAFGVAAATFAVGLGASLNQIQATESHGDVIVHPGGQMSGPPPGGPGDPGRPGGAGGPGGPPPAPDPVAVTRAIKAQPGTSGYSGVAQTEVTVAGLADALETLAFTGDNSSYGYEMIAGRWFSRPGEVVVAKPFLTATHTSVGDSIVLTANGTRITARIVGETFNIQSRGTQILTAAATLAVAEPDLRATDYHIALEPGTDPAAYVEALNAALASAAATAEISEDEAAEVVLVINALATLLTLILVTVAALGVLNMVVLETRERVRDLGVYKALGMTPRQTITMVIASVAPAGLLGGAVGAPLGVLLQRTTVSEMGRAAGFDLPASVLDIYQPAEFALLCVGGLLIAVLGALLPAGWAARTRTATALRTE